MTGRQSNNQWSGGIAELARPQKFLVHISAGKFLALNFLRSNGILFIDYLTKSQTINAEYFSSLLVQLKAILKEKRRGTVTKEVLFLHDSALSHRVLTTQK